MNNIFCYYIKILAMSAIMKVEKNRKKSETDEKIEPPNENSEGGLLKLLFFNRILSFFSFALLCVLSFAVFEHFQLSVFAASAIGTDIHCNIKSDKDYRNGN